MNKTDQEYLSKLFDRVVELETRLEVSKVENNNDTVNTQEQIEELKSIIEDLREFSEKNRNTNRRDTIELDTRLTLMDEQLNGVYNQLTRLENRTELLEEASTESNEAVREVVKKVITAIIGGIITYLFSRF